MLVNVKHTAMWRMSRGIKRAILSPRCEHLLPVEQCRSAMVCLDPPIALEAGSITPFRFRLENRSGVAWSSTGKSPVYLRCRWLTYRGDVFETLAPQSLPHPVYPGEPYEVTIPVQTPDYVGDFQLEVDFAQSGIGSFSERTSEAFPARVSIPVQGKRATDIDYHEVYRTADLESNHWWVVGAYHSKEQYETSSRERLLMLQKHGLTSDSRVLDVGCGTGQMAGPLMNFLSPNGAYFGTDIGREAIEFCNRTFQRRGFVFRQGEMTRLPFDAADGPFDMAIYFSVFTHTFIDETLLLLAETANLMSPRGSIIADVITSPLVERAAGHRGEMVVNRDYFLRQAAVAGLTGDVIGHWKWNAHADRYMYRLQLHSPRSS